jgi:hypothetical protein
MGLTDRLRRAWRALWLSDEAIERRAAELLAARLPGLEAAAQRQQAAHLRKEWGQRLLNIVYVHGLLGCRLEKLLEDMGLPGVTPVAQACADGAKIAAALAVERRGPPYEARELHAGGHAGHNSDGQAPAGPAG